jgi:hypothetical protein
MILQQAYLLTPGSVVTEIDLPLETSLKNGSTVLLTATDGQLDLEHSFPIGEGSLEIEHRTGRAKVLPDGSKEEVPLLRLADG